MERMLTTALPILPISDLRNKARDVLQRVKSQPIVITQRGRPQAVLIDFDTYNELAVRQAALENARDALILERAMATAQDFASFDELLEDYSQAAGERITLEEIVDATKDVQPAY